MTIAQRWDFGYHDPVFVTMMENLDSGFPVAKFSDLITILTDMGAFSLYKTEFFVDQGVPFLRVQNIQEYGVDLEKDTKYISQEYHELLTKSQLQPGDLLLTTKAIIGMAAVVNDSLGPCNMSQNLVRMRLTDGVNPSYIAVFLNSRLGRMQTETSATGPNQKYLNFERIVNLRIPLPPGPVQDRIAALMQEAYAARLRILGEADRCLSEIDAFVLNALNIQLQESIDKKRFTVSINSLSNGRFDVGPAANLFNPRDYTDISWNSLSELAYLPTITKVPSKDPEGVFSYVGMTDVDESLASITIHHLLGKEINANKIVFRGGDVVFARIEPCIYNRKIAIIPERVEEAIGSTELLVARAKPGVSAGFLLWILRSELIQRQIAGGMTGTTGRRRLPGSSFAALQIPHVPLKQQETIAAEATRLCDHTKCLRIEAERVVAEAKAKVERMILGQEAAV
jgi:type I restriction enzyme S subunit